MCGQRRIELRAAGSPGCEENNAAAVAEPALEYFYVLKFALKIKLEVAARRAYKRLSTYSLDTGTLMARIDRARCTGSVCVACFDVVAPLAWDQGDYTLCV